MSGLRARFKLSAIDTLGKLRRRVIGPYATAVLSQTENGCLLVPTGDMFVGRKLCFHGGYDRDDLAVLLNECDAESTVLVVGAHVGSLVVPLARKARAVAAVEANPRTFDLLRMNVGLNGLGNVSLHHVAAGDRAEDVEILAGHVNTGGSKIKTGDWNRWMYTHDGPETRAVRMERLDEVFPDAQFDLIVLDIEGSEARALGGMQRILSGCRVLMIEVVEHHLRNIARVTDEEFVSLLAPHFDEGMILQNDSKAARCSGRPYPRAGFGDMISECCRIGGANVLLQKMRSPS